MRYRGIRAAILLLAAAAARAAEPAVESFTLDDTTYGLQRSVWIYRTPPPPGAASAAHSLFLFLQKDYLDELGVPATLRDLAARGEIPPTLAVVLDTSMHRPAEIANRAKFDRFVTTDLLPWLRATLGALPAPEKVTIAGFSVGGLVAAYVASRHPDVFGNVLAQSGAFWRGDEGGNDPPEWLTGRLQESPRLPLRFYLEVGTGETHRAPNGVVFLEANRRLRDVLTAKGYVLRYAEVPRDIHDPEHLRPTLDAGILYLSHPEQ